MLECNTQTKHAKYVGNCQLKQMMYKSISETISTTMGRSMYILHIFSLTISLSLIWLTTYETKSRSSTTFTRLCTVCGWTDWEGVPKYIIDVHDKFHGLIHVESMIAKLFNKHKLNNNLRDSIYRSPIFWPLATLKRIIERISFVNTAKRNKHQSHTQDK